jgi:YHS domain-containing protein
MSGNHPERVIDPVCGMTVDVAVAEAESLTAKHDGRTYAFCSAGCLRALGEDPMAYAANANAQAARGIALAATGVSATASLVIDEGMRRWYESCSCCLSDAYPEIKAALDAGRAAQAAAPVAPGICEVAEAHAAHEEAVTR